MAVRDDERQLVVLETERLLMRMPQMAQDSEAMHALQADPVANRFSTPGNVATRQLSDALLQAWLAHWEASGFGHWAIALRQQPEQVIGFGGLMQRSVGGVEGLHLYFRFDPKYWGLGLASEMVMASLIRAFEQLGAETVLAVVTAANMPSRKTLERIGFLLKSSQADVPGQPPHLVYEMTAPRFAELPRRPPTPTAFGA